MNRIVLLLAVATACSHASSSSNQADSGGGDGANVDAADTGPCTDGATRCGANNDVESCANATWVPGEVCSLGCSAGACATSTTCMPGARACFGDVVGVCNATGTGWLYDSTCSDTCESGACAGACVAGAVRCNNSAVETCTGTSWTTSQTCANGCDSGQCVLDRLDVTQNMTLDGLVIVAGPVNVFSGATLTSSTGTLVIRAQSITVDDGGAIAISPTGNGTAGEGSPAASCYGQGVSSWSSGGGGGHAPAGYNGTEVGYTCGGSAGGPFGSGVEIAAESGGPGGPAAGAGQPRPPGGGVLELEASTITIAGTLHADGASGSGGVEGSGAGAGGSIVIAADQLSITGVVSAIGGMHGVAGQGGDGYIKLVSGASSTITGTLSGHVTQSVSPPLVVSSLTQPDPTLFYNDDFTPFGAAWSAPYPSRQGYYWHVDAAAVAPPTAATGTLAVGEAITVPRAAFNAGDNFIHVVSIDAMTNVGTIEATFHLQLNTTPPTLSSQTHPDQGAWSTSTDPLFAWTLPHGDASTIGIYYVLDQYGTTIPTTADTFVPITQHQLLHAGLADGIWAFHAIAIDHAGHLTRSAAHYQIHVGANPGNGRVLGQVTGPGGAIANATVSFNRGLLADQQTNSGGTYDLATVPPGTWEVTASAPGFQPQTQTISVAANGQIETDFALQP